MTSYLQKPFGGRYDTPILQIGTLREPEEIRLRIQPGAEPGLACRHLMLMSQVLVASKCWKSDQLGTWLRIQIWGWAQAPVFLIPHPTHPLPSPRSEIPHRSASGKRQRGLLWLRPEAQGSGAQQPEGGPFQGGSWWAGSPRVVGVWGRGEGRWSCKSGPVSSRTKASPPAPPGVGPADKWATASLINLWSGV